MLPLPSYRVSLLGLLALTDCSADSKDKHQQIERRDAAGNLRAVHSIRQEQLDGVSVWYYPTGTVEERSSYRAGVLHGLRQRYFRNGTLSETGRYTNGRKSGTTLLFDSLGMPVERQVYTTAGKLILANTYTPLGKPEQRILIPLLEAPDTISEGERYTGLLYFGMPLAHPATLLVGTVKQDRTTLSDTIAVIPQRQDGRFYFSLPPRQRGPHQFTYKLLQPHSETDSLSVDEATGSHGFFVQQRPTGR